MLWKVKSLYDIAISDQITLDMPPICNLKCHHLSGNRLVYAVDNCVRIAEGCLEEYQFHVLYQIPIRRSLWIQQVQIFQDLLVLQQSDGGLRFHDVSGQCEIQPVNMHTTGSGFRACPFGIVMSDFVSGKCKVWHWEDLLFRPRSDNGTNDGGTDLDISYDREVLLFKNMLIWSKGIAIMDSDNLTIANFSFRPPHEADDTIDLK